VDCGEPTNAPDNEFKLVDDHGKEYTVLEYQEGTEKPSLKWIKKGSSWFRLRDGTVVDKIDENTFKIKNQMFRRQL